MGLEREMRVGEELEFVDKWGRVQYRVALLKIKGGRARVSLDLPPGFRPVLDRAKRKALTKPPARAQD